MRAYEAGAPRGAFLAAIAAAQRSDIASAEKWIASGVEAGDWRSKYVRSLVTKGNLGIQEALSLAETEDIASYQGTRATNTGENRSGVLPPVAISMVQPTYPAGLSMVAAGGTVTAEFMVNEEGKPVAIQIIESSQPQLETAAVAAIAQWRFQPAKKDGQPWPIRVRVPIKFQKR